MVVRALNGVGMVASRARVIRPGDEYDPYFPKPTHDDPILSHNAENEDTLEEFIPLQATKFIADTAQISLLLKQHTLAATCKAIWNFVYHHIQYKLDEPHEEQVRRPARSWADRRSGVDCDCYTVFISSILLNLKIRHSIRMAGYDRTRGFQHVYIVVPKLPTSNLSKRSDYFTLDCVMEAFDAEKPFLPSLQRDKRMSVTGSLNGFPVRALNGGPGFNARSSYVYDDVYYHPTLGTWALKGIDGGYYIRGDKNLRYVEPLDGSGLSGGLLKKLVKTAVKIAKPLAKTTLNVALPGAGKALSLVKSLKSSGIAKSVVKGMVTDGKAALKSKASQVNTAVASTVEQANSGVNRFEQANFDTTALENKIRTSNNNTVQSLDTAKQSLQKSIQANNKAVVTSLDNVDKASKERLDHFASQVNAALSTVNERAVSTEDVTQAIKEVTERTASISAGTQAINREQTAIITKEAQQNENFRNQVTAWGKYILIAIALVFAWVLYSKNNSSNN